jgi:hypothetical protein
VYTDIQNRINLVTDSNSGANNLTFSKKEVFADDIESLALLAKLYFL